MNQLTIPNHSDRCYQEATKDVVFLFQWRMIRVRSEYDSDLPEGYEIDEEGDILDGNGEEVSLRKMLDSYPDHFYEIWHTERVYLSREEGEAYGKSRSYEWPEGWRVYGVASYGMMADLLKNT